MKPDFLNYCSITQCEGSTLTAVTTSPGSVLPSREYIPLHTPPTHYSDGEIARSFIIGDGVDKPLGVANTPGIMRADGPITCDAVIDAIYNVPPEFRRSGVFVVGTPQTAPGDVRCLTDADGRHLLAAALSATDVDRLCGFPLFFCEGLEGLIFGSFKHGYAIGNSAGKVGGAVVKSSAFSMIVKP